MNRIKPLSAAGSLAYFGIPAVFFFLITKFLTPALILKGIHPALSWFISGSLVFIPLFLLAVFLTKKDGYPDLWQRLNLKKMTLRDTIWAFSSLVIILLLTGLIMLISEFFYRNSGYNLLKTTPDFIQFSTLKGKEQYYLFAWLIMFFFNISGEELLWRGYLLPRQEVKSPGYGWIMNSALWIIFHFCFGTDLMIILLPCLIILPYAVYKTGNTWVGIIIHALYNGPIFLLITTGSFG